MTECTHCRKRYEDGIRFCPVDGFAVMPVADSYHTDPWVGRLLMGQFQIQSICGHGATGTVYRAVQAAMDRQVAVKILRPELLKDSDIVRRFVREARAGARLNHNNIATVHLVGQTEEGVPYIVMEYVEGPPLSSVISDGRPMSVRRFLHIGAQIASALSEAHTQGIVHRDLKPENILLTERRGERDVVKVVDFGIAKILVSTAPGEDPISRMGTVFGTPHYIAPEQAAGQEVDARTDIYSLGCILFQLATGRVLFEGQPGLQVLLKQVRDAPRDPRTLNPRLPDAVAEYILSMLAKDPRERPQRAELVAAELTALADGISASAEEAPARDARDEEPRPQPARSGRRTGNGSGRAHPGSGALRSEAASGRRPLPAELRRESAGGDADDVDLARWAQPSDAAPRRSGRPHRAELSADDDSLVAAMPFWRRNLWPIAGVGGAVTIGLLVGLLYAQYRGQPTPPPGPAVQPAVAKGAPVPSAPIRLTANTRSSAARNTPAPAPKKPVDPPLPEILLPSPLLGARTATLTPAPGVAPPVNAAPPSAPSNPVVAAAPPAAPAATPPAPAAPSPPAPAAQPAPPPAPAAAPTPPAPPPVAAHPPAEQPASATPPPSPPTEAAPAPRKEPAKEKEKDKDKDEEHDSPSSDPYQRLH